MKLVLAEDQSGVLHGERALTSEAIFVGRDPASALFFSQEQWPMVSRSMPSSVLPVVFAPSQTRIPGSAPS